jgi:hypothetical protein
VKAEFAVAAIPVNRARVAELRVRGRQRHAEARLADRVSRTRRRANDAEILAMHVGEIAIDEQRAAACEREERERRAQTTRSSTAHHQKRASTVT